MAEARRYLFERPDGLRVIEYINGITVVCWPKASPSATCYVRGAEMVRFIERFERARKRKRGRR